MRRRHVDSFTDALAVDLRSVDEASVGDYTSYRGRPVAFIENVLGEVLTPDMIELVEQLEANERVLARSANAVGKTFVAARYILYKYKCYKKVKVYCAAAPPEQNLRNILWSEIRSCMNANPAVFSDDKVRDLEIYREEDEFIAGVSIPTSSSAADREERFSGKHSPNLIFVLDEAAGLPTEVYRGIESCVSGGDTKLLCLFNPRQPLGPMYEFERSRGAVIVTLSAFDHPNVITGENQIPGAVTRDVTVRRINEWSRPLISGEDASEGGTFEVPEYLVGCQVRRRDGTLYEPLEGGVRKVTDTQMFYMVLGEYPPTADERLIQDEWIEAARERWDGYVALYGEIPPAAQPVMGQDVAQGGGDFNVAYLRYGGFVTKPKRWRGLDPAESADYGAQIARVNGAKYIYVDGTGLGAGIAPMMRRQNLRAFQVMVAQKPTYTTERGEFYQMRDQLLWSLREWLRTDPQSMLPPEDRLIDELRTPTFGPNKQGKIYVSSKDEMRSALGRSPDDMEALALTFYPPPRDVQPVYSRQLTRQRFTNTYYGG